ncbi:uclacyanin-3-like [Phragmites australis]|uniref:uclacyanin-3-like n=1 Tax=Phragmites australis TaxID=29695 RepID=UPI002D774B53|nr:uclacyanin-3-like [Phragmites australis]
MAGLIAGMVLLAAVVAPAYATDYVVGDSSGWTSGADYTTWAKDKTFRVGDTLVFQYSTMHNVAEVSSADYSACSASNSIQSYSDQNTKIALTAPGTRYFICGTPGHCSNGMKLAVTVAAAASTTPASPSATPATPSAPGTETPPETSTPSTPAATTAPTTKSTSGSTGEASGSEARLVIGLSAGAVGLVGLALMV